MCGIAGLMFYNGERSQDQYRQIRSFYNYLLMQTQDRGKDATGVATLGKDGAYSLYKDGSKAEEAAFKPGMIATLTNLNENCAQIMGHCRQLTKGFASNNFNNHPIETEGTIVGIHNGALNDEQDNIIFENLGIQRKGDVDSEAIFALINHIVNEEMPEPNSNEVLVEKIKSTVKETASILDAKFAIALMDKRLPRHLFMARNNERPIVIAKIPQWNLFVYASEEKHIFNAIIWMKRSWVLTTGEHLKVDAYMSELKPNSVYAFNIEDYENSNKFTCDMETFVSEFSDVGRFANNTTVVNPPVVTEKEEGLKEKITNAVKKKADVKIVGNSLKAAAIKGMLPGEQFKYLLWELSFNAAIARLTAKRDPINIFPNETSQIALNAVTEDGEVDEGVLLKAMKAIEIMSYSYGFSEGYLFGKYAKHMFFKKAIDNKDVYVIDTKISAKLDAIKDQYVDQVKAMTPDDEQVLRYVLGYAHFNDDEVDTEINAIEGNVHWCQACRKVFLEKEMTDATCPECGQPTISDSPNEFVTTTTKE